MKTNIYKRAKGPNSNHIFKKTEKTPIIHLYTRRVSHWVYKDEKINTLRIRGRKKCMIDAIVTK